ncbi:olfactory receptor 2K2-like [Osmerus eperlanus]|uniref:olfactory receptor 2K2-like n=1 Tax=Osmerus eperlanus TaxID=29151 RepID=UPI002E10A53E
MQNPSSEDFNVTHVTEFLIVGTEQGLKNFYVELSFFILVVYIMILIGNLIIFTLVMTNYKLRTPMYIFLGNLSFIDIVIATSVHPKFITMVLQNDFTITFSGCFIQMYVYLGVQTVEGFLLCVMAYDRYVAICNPLRYSSIISGRVCAVMVTVAWVSGLLMPCFSVIFASQLPFCNTGVKFWFCDYPAVVWLSCWDTTFLIDVALSIAVVVMYIPFMLIVWSYYRIVLAICKIATSEGRIKAFSTCSSHLTVVLAFYLAHSCVYISAKVLKNNSNMLILISIINSALVPVLNPLIYTFRNKEIKDALQKLCCHVKRQS